MLAEKTTELCSGEGGKEEEAGRPTAFEEGNKERNKKKSSLNQICPLFHEGNIHLGDLSDFFKHLGVARSSQTTPRPA